MLTFLFWNMGGEAAPSASRQVLHRRQTLADISANLVRHHAVDVLILAECPLTPLELLWSLNARNPRPFQPPDPGSLCHRLLLYTRFPIRQLQRECESAVYTSRRIRLPRRPELTLFAAHLAGKRHRSGASQSLSLVSFSRVIRDLESKVRHRRTVLVGDLNVNPFEDGIVGAEGLNAAMTREIARRGQRTIDAVQHPFFYNPMWCHFGDATHGRYPPSSPHHEPPGTWAWFKTG